MIDTAVIYALTAADVLQAWPCARNRPRSFRDWCGPLIVLSGQRPLPDLAGAGSGIASPSLRGSEAPKFTPLALSRATAWPPPITPEYAPCKWI